MKKFNELYEAVGGLVITDADIKRLAKDVKKELNKTKHKDDSDLKTIWDFWALDHIDNYVKKKLKKTVSVDEINDIYHKVEAKLKK